MTRGAAPVWAVFAALGLSGAATAAELDEPLDLPACIVRALSHNDDLLGLVDGAASAEAARELPLAEYRLQVVPTVEGGLQGANDSDQSYQLAIRRKLLPTGTELEVTSGTRVFSQVPQVTVPHFTETRLRVAQPLRRIFSPLEHRERIDDAESRLRTAELAVAGGREDLVLRVIRGFYDVVRAGELLAVSEASLRRVRRLSELAGAKLEIGAVSKMDVFRADLQLARFEGSILDQRARREGALDELKILLGLPIDAPLAIDARIDPRLEPEALDFGLAKARDVALSRRAALRDARQQLEAARRRLEIAERRIWPDVDLVGSYARQGAGESFDDSLDLERDVWTLGLRSSVSLDRTAERVARREAELAMRAARRRLRRLRADVSRQVREGVRQLARAASALELASEISAQAEQQAELARFRYEKGVTDNGDLVEAETSRADARAGVVLASIDRALAVAEIRRAVGRLEGAFVAPDAALPEPRDFPADAASEMLP